jgi:hypothetical protein
VINGQQDKIVSALVDLQRKDPSPRPWIWPDDGVEPASLVEALEARGLHARSYPCDDGKWIQQIADARKQGCAPHIAILPRGLTGIPGQYRPRVELMRDEIDQLGFTQVYLERREDIPQINRDFSSTWAITDKRLLGGFPSHPKELSCELTAKQLIDWVDQPETHQKIVGDYEGGYALGVTDNPPAFLLRVEPADVSAFPTKVNIHGVEAPVVVKGNFVPPVPISQRR